MHVGTTLPASYECNLIKPHMDEEITIILHTICADTKFGANGLIDNSLLRLGYYWT